MAIAYLINRQSILINDIGQVYWDVSPKLDTQQSRLRRQDLRSDEGIAAGSN